MTIFTEALERSDLAERAAYLDRACGTDATLRTRIEALLAAYTGAGQFLEPRSPTRSDPAGATGSLEPGPRGGERPAPTPADVTASFDGTSRGTAPRATELTVPGYEIEGELGRGGTGVVYRATQTGLNRPVALKVLVAGPFAGPALRARFLLEAESVAALEHPNVVRVFAFGESGGHPYLTMEFVPGGTLADLIKRNGPLAGRRAAELMMKLAGAVAHAHSRGVVHRDIKPLNVLLTAEGEPRLTDFGLAKVGRADQNLSATGQVLGTPAYMAPEQAAGKVREVGTPADVYALGAVLYDLLTGRPPFQADSSAVTLQKVLTEEPERPCKLNATVPRDLETICLKCLEKEPARRYPTAQALADDLARYLRNEPIGVRPVGVFERGYKWIKRNKVVAAASSTVFLALVVGAGVSLGFGLEAQKQAAEATRKQKEADEAAARERAETHRADREKADAILARNDLKQANEDLNGALARALLGPLAAERADWPLTDYEGEAFRALAVRRNTPVSFRFLEEATGTLPASRQLEGRAKFALHAAIGLDVEARNKAEELFLSRLRDPNVPAEQRTNIARAVATWEPVSQPLVRETTEILIEAMTRTSDQAALRILSEKLDAVSQRLTPTQAARVAGLQREALPKVSDEFVQRDFANVLARVARQLPPEQAVQVLTDALGRTARRIAGVPLAEGIAAVARQLPPDRAGRTCETAAKVLTDALAKATDLDLLRELPAGIVALAPHLSTEAATRTLEVLTDLMVKNTHTQVLDALREAVAAVARGLEPERVAGKLVDTMSKTSKGSSLRALAFGLAAVVQRLPAEQAAKWCEGAAKVLTGAMTRTTDSEDLSYLALGIAALVNRLTPERADAACAEAAKILTDTAGRATDPFALEELTNGFIAVSPRPRPELAVRVLDVLIEAAIKTTVDTELYSLTRSIQAVAPHLSPGQGARAARSLLDAMPKHTSSVILQPLASNWAAVASHLTPEQADGAVKPLTEAMSRSARDGGSFVFAEVLVGVTKKLPVGRAVPILTDALARAPDSGAVRQLAWGAAELADRLLADQAARLVRSLTDAVPRASSPDGVRALGEAAALLVPRLSAEQFETAIRLLADTRAKLTEPADLSAFFSAFGTRAAQRANHLVPERAAAVIKLLTDVMPGLPYPHDSGELAEAVVVLTERLAPERASEILADAMTRTTNAHTLRALAHGVVTVARRLPPEQAAQACERATQVLTGALTRILDPAVLAKVAAGATADPGAVAALTEGIAAVNKRFHPEQTAKACELAARVLTDAMTRTTQPLQIGALAGGVIELAPYLTPEQITRTAWVLLDMVHRAEPTYGSGRPQKCFATLVLSETPEALAGNVGSTVLAAGVVAPPSGLLPALPLLHPHFHPQARPLPPQLLVDLLKHPLCVGAVRRSVLDALEFTYQRPFADVWEFVEYAKEHQPQLDLLTPPQRTGAAGAGPGR
jgi:hypothetical protein